MSEAGKQTVSDRLAKFKTGVASKAKAHAIVAQLAAEDVGRTVVLRYGGAAIKVRLKLCTASDGFDAVAAAYRKVKGAGLEGTLEERQMLDRCELIELVARSVFDPDSGERIFVDGDELAATLPEPALTQLTKEYGDLAESIDLVQPELADSVFELLKKKAWTPLSDIVPSLPRNLLDTLVGQLLISLQGSSSTTES